MREVFLTADQHKVIYRGNFTFKQAGLYLGIGVEKIILLVDKGELGVNFINGKKFISRAECDRFMRENTKYKIKSGR